MPSLFTKPLQFLVLIIFVTGLSGCALFRANDAESEQALYERASNYIDNQSYDLAIDALVQLQNRFPFGRYAQQTQLDLMYARYRSRDFAQAVLDADRFTRLNPDHPSVDYAWYLKGMSYFRLYEQNAGITGRGDLAQRSQQDGERAFNALKDYADRFPNSDYRSAAIDTMILLKDALARHELVVADYYMRREAWIAAVERAKVVQAHYPGVSAQADALVVLIESYEALDRQDDRAVVLAQLREQYPNHPTLRSGNYRSPYIQQERWWLKLLTLGWFS